MSKTVFVLSEGYHFTMFENMFVLVFLRVSILLTVSI